MNETVKPNFIKHLATVVSFKNSIETLENDAGAHKVLFLVIAVNGSMKN